MDKVFLQYHSRAMVGNTLLFYSGVRKDMPLAPTARPLRRFCANRFPSVSAESPNTRATRPL